jgi:hypothetical protein
MKIGAILILAACQALSLGAPVFGASPKVDECMEPILCTSRQAFKRWLKNRPGDRSVLVKKGWCFRKPEAWNLAASDESPWDPVAKWTIKRPGQPDAVFWTDCHIGDPADY